MNINKIRDRDFNSFFMAKKQELGKVFTYLNKKIVGVIKACLDPLKTNSNSLSSSITFRANPTSTEGKKIFVFGDIHGELGGFCENLLDAGLINSERKWIGESCVMVQMGDVIDRGVESEEAWDYLNELQAQAEKTSGKVVRLTGNHELMVLQGNFHYASRVIKDPVKFGEKIREEVLSGNVCLAYSDGKRLYTHAGLRSDLREQLINEIKVKLGSNDQIFVEDIVVHLNSLFVKAVENNDYSHAIFQAGRSRGGSHEIGGVLWEDVSGMLKSAHARDIPQVIGHNPPRGRGESPIRITESKRLVNVDAGLNHLYGGNQAYVAFEEADITVRNKVAGLWTHAKTKDLA